MNRFVTATVIGGAALAVGVIPTASQATAATPPTPIAAMATTPTDAPAPTPPASPSPGGHQSHKHHGRHGTSHRSPGSHRPSRHPGTGADTGTDTGTAGDHAPGGHSPSRHQPGHRRPPTRPGDDGTPTTRPDPTPRPDPIPAPAPPQAPTTDAPTKPVAEPRIVGGKDATDAPWAAQVSWDQVGYQCSGTVVAPDWVLTAQHCVTRGDMTVQTGSPQLGGGTQVSVDRTEIDPAGDMALLHLAKAVDVPTVPLADADPKVDATNTILGWGKTSPDSGPARNLKVAQVRVTGVDCADAFHGKAICSTAINGSALNGDSGGPEMSDGAQVGVCSTGEPNGSQQYASIAANREWIREVASV